MKSERAQGELQRLAYSKLSNLSPEASNRLTTLPHRDLDSLVFDEGVNATIAELCQEHERRFDLVAAGLAPRSRVLLHGPPGNGKTSLAAAFAVRLGMTGYALSIHSTVSSYMGSTGRAIAEAWEVTRAEQQLLLLDELDAISGTRGGGTGSEREYNLIVATLLKLLDEPTTGVIVASTNRIDVVDPAVRRRFDVELELKGPSEGDMMELAHRFAKKYAVPACIEGARSFCDVEKLMLAAARRKVLGIPEHV
jgi:SpoVK/Ycf46/Vps4 family AAA+-type ATPase